MTSLGLLEVWQDLVKGWRSRMHELLEGKGTPPLFETFDVDFTPPGVRPYSCSVDRSGLLWIGYSNAQLASYRLARRADGSSRLELVRALTPGVHFPTGFPKCFIPDSRGLVWYAVGDCVVLLDPSKRNPLVRTFGEAEEPLVNYVRAFYEDHYGDIWAGTFNRGVARLSTDSILTGRFDRFSLPVGLPDTKITSILQDRLTGTVWVGTERGGIGFYTNGIFTTRSTGKGWPGGPISSLMQDREGKIWIGTSTGISWVDTSSDRNVREKTAFLGLRTFCSGATRNGLTWFVTRQGLLVCDPDTRSGLSIPPTPFITRIRSRGSDLGLDTTLQLTRDQNSVTIDFVAISLAYGESIRYRYRLLGSTDNRPSLVKTPSITYAALPPGTYAFEVAAVDGFGHQSKSAATVHFTIDRAFWSTWWFVTILWFAATTLIAGGVRYIEIRKLKREIARLEQAHALERERARISQDMHDEVGSSLSEIAILTELAKRKPEEAGDHVEEISERTAELIGNVSEIVWAMNPKNDTADNLIGHIRRYAVKYLGISCISCEFIAPDIIPPHPVAAENRRNVFLVVKEALHNVVKHARGSAVRIHVTMEGGRLQIVIEDNGQGFVLPDHPGSGNGLVNMRKRMADIGGEFLVQPGPSCGTRVVLRTTLSVRDS